MECDVQCAHPKSLFFLFFSDNRIPLPKWVLKEIKRNRIHFENGVGDKSVHYISFGCDDLPLLKGRSPADVYSNFIKSFINTFSPLLGRTMIKLYILFFFGMAKVRGVPDGDKTSPSILFNISSSKQLISELTHAFYKMVESHKFIPGVTEPFIHRRVQ